ncbi:hypothetical protein C9374_003553 [Naegleria lovaniensis]|uniref:Protein kinase domain-containing protein n=1 Tax=Naegleria lovaniensis TaxID=51637 RepID=A0AA88KSL1_NAELO|nr:uncharacterized protein C9374_003553 [Naegleria lovaniensis]KAG2393789.1 hypothetical protein C9374_003553 [Naegleria lovaniensis]
MVMTLSTPPLHHTRDENQVQYEMVKTEITMSTKWDPMQEQLFGRDALNKHMTKVSDSQTRNVLSSMKWLQNLVVYDPGEATSFSRRAFNTELGERQNISFTFYVTNNMSQYGMTNVWCEHVHSPCVTMAQIFTRLDELIKVFMNNDTISNSSSNSRYNVHVSIVLLTDTNPYLFCDHHRLVTPQSPKFNYLFEFYSFRYYSNVIILQKLQCFLPLMNFRSDITRIYFHELEMTIPILSPPGLSLELYNCFITNSVINVGYNTDLEDTSKENVTRAKDLIFEYVVSQEQMPSSYYFGNFENAHFGNLTLMNVISFGFRNVHHMKMTDAIMLKGSYYFFNSLTLQFDNLKARNIAFQISKVDSCVFSNSLFTVSGYFLPIILAEFGREFIMHNVAAWKVDQFLAVNAYETVWLRELNVFNCSVERNAPRIQRSIIDVIATSTVTIEDSQFSQNSGQFGGACYFETLATLTINNTLFTECKSSGSGGSIFIESFSENSFMQPSSFIRNSKFIKNFAQIYGGALYLNGAKRFSLLNNEFSENTAQLSGGALFIARDSLTVALNGCLFVKNQVLFDVASSIEKNILYKLYEGAGGAVTIVFNSRISPASYDDARFIENRASRGGAFYLGDRYSSELRLFGGNLKFEKNYASVAGGAIYIGMSRGLPSSSFINSGVVFKDNNAGMVGNDYSTSCQNLTFDSKSSQVNEIAIGESSVLGLNMIASFNQTVPLRFEKFILYHPSLLLKIDKLEFNKLMFTPYLQTNNHSSLSLPLTILIATETDKVAQFNLTLQPCGQGFQLADQVVDGKVVYSCKPYVDTVTLIIAIVVPLSIVMFLTGILLGVALIYGVVFIVAKLRILKRKEKAERELERKLMDKRMVFNLGDDEIQSQAQMEIESSSNMNHSKSSRAKSQASGLGLDAPLLEKSFLLEPIEYLNRKNQPSFIIPIEKLTVVKKIGEGGNGVIYLAKWLNLDVAIKSLKTSDDQEFEKEALILSNLRHPNVVPFYGLCITEHSRYIVTQYLAKGSLDKVLYQCRIGKESLTLKQRIEILLGTSHGMEYLHSLRPVIVHRDLKPANVLLDEHNTSKVCDFGLVKLLGNTFQTTMTTNIGTIFYLSPENFGSSSSTTSSKITHKTDVYSFGIMMYEVLFLENPYLNGSSKRIHYFKMKDENYSATDEDHHAFTIPTRVWRGERPFIPFQTDEEFEWWMEEFAVGVFFEGNSERLRSVVKSYVALMKQCWDQEAQKRPEFSEITQHLQQLLEL